MDIKMFDVIIWDNGLMILKLEYNNYCNPKSSSVNVFLFKYPDYWCKVFLALFVYLIIFVIQEKKAYQNMQMKRKLLAK